MGSSCRRAVTLILITKATGVQSYNPLLCPMGVGVTVCVCVCARVSQFTKYKYLHHFRGQILSFSESTPEFMEISAMLLHKLDSCPTTGMAMCI